MAVSVSISAATAWRRWIPRRIHDQRRPGRHGRQRRDKFLEMSSGESTIQPLQAEMQSGVRAPGLVDCWAMGVSVRKRSMIFTRQTPNWASRRSGFNRGQTSTRPRINRRPMQRQSLTRHAEWGRGRRRMGLLMEVFAERLGQRTWFGLALDGWCGGWV